MLATPEVRMLDADALDTREVRWPAGADTVREGRQQPGVGEPLAALAASLDSRRRVGEALTRSLN